MKMIQIKAPAKYVQGEGCLKDIGKHALNVGRNFLILSNTFSWELVGETVQESMKRFDRQFVYEEFGGECTEAECRLVAEKALKEKVGAVIGIGGGKILDTAKAAAEFARLPVILVPTAASTDAPCSSVAVLYHKDHSFDRYLYTEWGPEIVLMDSSLVVNAPAKLLAAGMADGLSTWLENRAYAEGMEQNRIETGISSAVLLLSKDGYDKILQYGKQAYEDVANHVHSEAVEKVINANIYISAVGFENGGLAAAHSIANALTHVQGLNIMHGEAVAIGIIAQLRLEQRSEAEVAEMEAFLQSIGLPTRLKDLPITFSKDVLDDLADYAAHSYETNIYLPFDMSIDAILKALA